MSHFIHLIILYISIYTKIIDIELYLQNLVFFLINIEREKKMMRLIRFVPKLSDRHVQQEVSEMIKDDVQ